MGQKMVISGREETEQSLLRISDIAEELQEMLMPIDGYDEMPLVSLEEAVKPLISLLPKIRDYAHAGKQRCKKPADNLTPDESASIMLYTMEWKPLDQCLYVALNRTLRSKDRQQLKPWFLYLKLFLTALWRLPSTQKFIYRSVRFDLSDYYPTGKTVVWWGFSFCTVSVDVLKSKRYLRTSGAKTVFVIDCHSGKDISKHSYHPTKDQILLLCATQFRVLSSLDQGYGLHIIQLQEIQPKMPLLQPVTVVKRIPTFNEHRSKQLEQIIAQSGATRSIVMLNCMQLYDQDIDIVVKQTLYNTQCMWLSLQYNEITSVGAAILAEALNNNRTLYTLSLLANQVSDMGVKTFAETLTYNNCTLTMLDLSENGITDAGCEYLSQMLKTNQTMTLLYLSKNEITDRGVRLLCETIKNHNQGLQGLCLSWNKLMTDESVGSLCDMIKYHQSSKILEVKDCNLSPMGEEKLQIAADAKKNFELFV